MTQKLTFHEFCQQISGYNFFSETGTQIYKYQLYWWNIPPADVFKKYKSVLRPKPREEKEN